MGTYAEFNARTIYKYVTPTRVLFLSLDALDFTDDKGEPTPRMKVRCGLYDETREPGDRITDEVESYVPIGQFLVLCHDVLTGVVARKKKSAAQVGEKYPVYFRHYGGSKHPRVVSTSLSLVDGMDEKASFAFSATACAGKETKAGGIIPLPAEERGNAPEKRIYINMPDNEMKEFCLIGKAYIEQYIALDIQKRLATVRAQRESYTRAKEEEYIAQHGFGSASQKRGTHNE